MPMLFWLPVIIAGEMWLVGWDAGNDSATATASLGDTVLVNLSMKKETLGSVLGSCGLRAPASSWRPPTRFA
jgi:hypothetical protein